MRPPVAVRWCFSQTSPPRLAVPRTLEHADDEALAEGGGEMAQGLHCPALYRGQFIGGERYQCSWCLSQGGPSDCRDCRDTGVRIDVRGVCGPDVFPAKDPEAVHALRRPRRARAEGVRAGLLRRVVRD